VAAALAGWKAAPPAATSAVSVKQPARRRIEAVNWPVLRLLVALGLAVVPSLLWSLQPVRLATQASFGSVLSFGELLRQYGIGQLLAVVAALGLGVGFFRVAQKPEPWIKRWLERMAAVASLGWLLDGTRWLLQWIDLVWRNTLLVVEGEGYLGWVALVLLVAVLIVQL